MGSTWSPLPTSAPNQGAVVRKGGVEPPRPKAQEPKSCVSANFTTPAGCQSNVAPVPLGITLEG
jgi:hypothetical protein